MELTNENYFSKESSMEYMGSSQFKEFLKCPSCAIARINREFVEEKTKALMMGSYIDAYFSKEMDDFIKNNPDIFNAKTGELKTDFKQCEDIIKFIEKDEKFMKYLSGDHQTIMTGVIAGVKFKIKIDSYFPGKLIVDQKIVRDFNPVYDENEHCLKSFVDYYGYNIQGALYREIVRQNTISEEHPNGLILPFVLAVATKEKIPSKGLFEIDSADLDNALEFIKEYAPTFDKMKKGEIEPTKCGKCDWCKSNSMVTGIFSYHILDPEERN